MDFEGMSFANALEKAGSTQKKQFKDVFSLFSIAIVNYITALAPSKVVLCGKLFAEKEIRDIIIDNYMKKDESLETETIAIQTFFKMKS